MAIGSVPQPPFSEELLADLHSGNLEPELCDRLWPVARADSEAQRYLHALDDVTVHIRGLADPEVNLHPVPADVTARMEQFLEELDLPEYSEAELDELPLFAAAHNGHIVPGAPPATAVPNGHTVPGAPLSGSAHNGHVIPDAPSGTEESGRIAPVVDLRARRVTRMRWFAAAAAVIAVVAGLGIVTRILGDDGETTPPIAQPTPGTDDIGDDLTATAALAALGHNNVTGPLGSRSALTQCVQAAGLERVILGSTDMRFQGKDAVLILLSGPVAVLPVTPTATNKPVKVTALVVGPGCTTGDPQVRNITDIG